MRSERDTSMADQLRQVTRQADSIESKLTTHERVIARVTDGIYRQPGSAIRELIANAYDADATWVSVKTDAPKFSRITVEDDGTGMTPDAVVHLLHNIGGSAKRTEQGQELGIASSDNVLLSPKGRRLIGKLGIGIFSVSQLTHSFQITTKTIGDNYRTVVLVSLRQFADESADGGETEFEAGRFQVWREKTDDALAHGTTIVLNAIRPQTRDSLRSEQLWSAIDNPISEESEAKSLSTLPQYHIGRLDVNGRYVNDPRYPIDNLPWLHNDSPRDAFQKMVKSVWSYAQGRTAVKLADIFDTYLQMLWNLALSLPLPYVSTDILDESVSDEWAYFYKLSNAPRGSAQQIQVGASDLTVRQLAGFDMAERAPSRFDVLIDGVQLSRPLKFRDLPTTQHVLKKPMVFLGSMRENFSGFPREFSAGPLEFEAYLFWNPRIAPTEHQGALVRIHGASGTLFDSTFFNYQVAELTRLRQITCEIFVKEGLEAALNIDRESFNTAHPHTVLLTRWLHGALRQLATAQKREAQELRRSARESSSRVVDDRITEIIKSANALRTDGEGVLPSAHFVREEEIAPRLDLDLTPSISLDRIAQELPFTLVGSPTKETIRKLEGITNLLSVYGLFDDLSPKERDNLLGSILGILEAENHD